MRAWRALAGCLAGFLALPGCGAEARTDRLPVQGRMEEQLTDRVRTTGGLLAGLHLGLGTGRFRPDELRLVLAREALGRSVCLRLFSRDGRYRAQARYEVPPDAAPVPALDFPTQHRSDVERLQAGELAARAVLLETGEPCDDWAEGPLLPGWVRGTPGPATVGPAPVLVALLNAGEARARARLLAADGQALTPHAPCLPVRGDSIVVFNLRCEIALPESRPGSALLLEVALEGLTGRQPGAPPRFPVLLPPAPR